ncbi:MAG: hypothetical protein J6V09_01195 [Clostridia bacterium]|nr:hypothetical protein [Clostridia bacterium]
MNKTVNYRDFGAVGDGVTNDFFAIKAAHDYANSHGLSVVANGEDTYLISDTRDEAGNVYSVEIKTNVDWRGAKIIIDDRAFRHYDGTGVTDKDVFVILPDSEPRIIEDKNLLSKILGTGFNKSTERIVIPGVDYPVMIIPYDSSNRVYRRRGFNSYVGGVTHEVIVLDKDGYIDPETKLFFDYKSLDAIKVFRLDEPRITIENATFTTIASHYDMLVRDEDGKVISRRSGYIQRGIEIMRSFTTAKNLAHYVEGEITLAEQASGILGPVYNGFYGTTNVHGVTFEDCILTARRCFRRNNVPGAGNGTTGTYDYTVLESNKVVFKNCIQSNFWIKIDMQTGEITPVSEGTPGAQLSMTPTSYGNINFKIYWGLGGSNYTKNLEFIGSTMSRFDAHAGIMNGRIVDSTVTAISLVGGGDMLVENTRWFGEGIRKGDALLTLRSDYASPWDGKITLRNVKAYIHTEKPSFLIGHSYLNWYCGYDSCYPSLEVENLEYYDTATGKKLPGGYEIFLSRASMSEEPGLHLSTTVNTHPIYATVDNDQDGFIDGTDIPFDGTTDKAGIEVTDSYKNLNPVRPPEYIKITENHADISYLVYDTSKFGVSDGKYYSDEDSRGGFFGGTKFYYGNGESDYYPGTDHKNTKTFKFT